MSERIDMMLDCAGDERLEHCTCAENVKLLIPLLAAAERRLAKSEQSRIAYAQQVAAATEALRAEHATRLAESEARAAVLRGALEQWTCLAHGEDQPCAACGPSQAALAMDAGSALLARLAQAEERAATAEAELARLREYPAGTLPWCEVCGDMVAFSVTHSLGTAREALAKYGRHQGECPAWPRWTFVLDPACDLGPCSCGLAAALAGPGGDGE